MDLGNKLLEMWKLPVVIHWYYSFIQIKDVYVCLQMKKQVKCTVTEKMNTLFNKANYTVNNNAQICIYIFI